MAALPSLVCFLLLALVAVEYTPVAGLECFQCNSMTDVDCAILQGTKYLHNCTKVGKEPNIKYPSICRIHTIRMATESTDRVDRSCGYENHPRLSCYHFANQDFKSSVCECKEDGCNAAGKPLAALGAILAAGLLHLLMVTH